MPQLLRSVPLDMDSKLFVGLYELRTLRATVALYFRE
jgi:hypothetical protein